jgi:hypothetical protein
MCDETMPHEVHANTSHVARIVVPLCGKIWLGRTILTSGSQSRVVIWCACSTRGMNFVFSDANVFPSRDKVVIRYPSLDKGRTSADPRKDHF